MGPFPHPSPDRARGWSAALAGILVAAALRVLAEAVAPERGEPLLLRWARAAADHPVRTAAAVLLLVLALAPGRRAPPAPIEPEGREAPEPPLETSDPLVW